ncbi:MAG: LptF/LptG family permease [Mariprofundaceae bacterium]|nr:LptF/LptG family permease [Mariprofundaceae bacterium]
MPALFRWIFLGCLGRVVATLVTLLAIFMIAEAFDKARYLGHGLTTSLMVEYLLLKIPFMVGEFMPVILLLATSIFIAELSRNHELVAMRAAGLGVNKIIMPLLAVATLAAGITFIVGEWIAPVTNQRLDTIDRINIHHRPDTRQGIQWLKDGRRFFRLQPLGKQSGEQQFHLVMLKTDDAGHWKERVDAARASYHDGVWSLTDVDISHPREDGMSLSHLAHLQLAAGTGPDTADPPSPRYMRFFELMRYAKNLEQAGLASANFHFSLQRKLAVPALCLVMVLLATALCMRMGSRLGAASWGIAASIGLGLGAYVTGSATQIAAAASYLPPGFAAWLPDIIATGLTGFLLLHQEGY